METFGLFLLPSKSTSHIISGQKKPQPKEIAYKTLEHNVGNGTRRLQSLINRTAIGTDPKLVTDQDNIKYNVVKQYKVHII